MRLFDSAPLIICYHKHKVGIAVQSRVFSAQLYSNAVFRHGDVLQGSAMPAAYGAFIRKERVANLLPCPVVDVAVAEYHLFIGILHLVDDGANLLF